MAGCGTVAVLEDDQNAVTAVEHVVGNAASQSAMPESAVTHQAHHAVFHRRSDAGRRRQSEPVSQHGIAEIEGRDRRHRVAPDIRADVDLPDIPFDQLQCAQHRTLGAPCAEGRRPRGDRRSKRRGPIYLGVGGALDDLADLLKFDTTRQAPFEKSTDAGDEDRTGIVAGKREHLLSNHCRVDVVVVEASR